MYITLLTTALCTAAFAPMSPPVEIIAHRGASADAPENTVASIRLAWEQKANVARAMAAAAVDGITTNRPR
jgi:glycerophosphoryl diester phosphodiesterase